MPPQLLPSVQTQLPAGASGLSGDPKVSATALLKMEEHLGKDALDDSSKYHSNNRVKCILDDHNLFDDDPLLGVYRDLGQPLSSQRRGYQQYPVYLPKSSSLHTNLFTFMTNLGSAEYNSIRSSIPNPLSVPGNYRVSVASQSLCIYFGALHQMFAIQMSSGTSKFMQRKDTNFKYQKTYGPLNRP
jgi:hypothetical protein